MIYINVDHLRMMIAVGGADINQVNGSTQASPRSRSPLDLLLEAGAIAGQQTISAALSELEAVPETRFDQ